jgi:FixJ family two-component response regulator
MNGARVYVIDDDVSFLSALSRFLRVSGFPVSVYSSAMDFLSDFQRTGMRGGCVLTDLQMPDMDGMALQQSLHKLGSTIPMVFLTGHGDIPHTVQAMRGGAEDFLTKHSSKEQLIDAVKRALARSEEQEAERVRQVALRAPFALLTDREREVLQHVVKGELNKQIAACLGIHERTVKLHRTNITTKLKVHSVAELTRMVQQAGMFDSP